MWCKIEKYYISDKGIKLYFYFLGKLSRTIISIKKLEYLQKRFKFNITDFNNISLNVYRKTIKTKKYINSFPNGYIMFDILDIKEGGKSEQI